METHSKNPFAGPLRHGMDPDEVDNAWHLLRHVSRRLDRIARRERWPTPFAPTRYLVLVRLERATKFGLSPGALARALGVRPSTLAHHLDGLERAGLIHRRPWMLHDQRRVAVRLTDTGHYAVRRFTRGS
ncbi:MAG: helix-turn-helix domain-containing protein [Gemmatimonadota bacterium]